MFKIPEKIINETENFKESLFALLEKDLSKGNLKKFCAPWGIYEEKIPEKYMLRVGIPAGVITLDQIRKINAIAVSFGKEHIHLTTRQDIQFHGLSLTDIPDIMLDLLGINLISKGTGGNCVRNIACSPLSGVSFDEVFDVTEYAIETMNHLLKDSSSFSLPRKFKISFSNSNSDTAYATISDIGFIAKIQDSVRGFEVYGGGSLGNNPSIAIKLADFIPATDLFYYVEGMKELFEVEGDRDNRNKARIRFILYKLGEEEFRNKYLWHVEKVKKIKELDLEPKIISNSSDDINQNEDISFLIKNQLVIQQKNKDYAVNIHPTGGNLRLSDLNRLINFINRLNYRISIRLTNTQGLLIRDLKSNDAYKLFQIISEFTSSFDIDNSLSCVGSEICKTGICNSQHLLAAIIKKFKNVDPILKAELPRLHISGCFNSCGQHLKAEIGLAGKIKKVNNELTSVYKIYLGGHIGASQTRLAADYGEINAEMVPEFIYELAKLKRNSEIADITEFLEIEKENVLRLIARFGDNNTKNCCETC
ncbi:MAG: hypothetical protein ACD_20C00123G0004 [uncultured bacterium]|nr:MAG: hypothetical protein ACD_20C00123G0004 [uncultured bacterium]